MFDNAQKLADGIYLFSNFLSKEEADSLYDIAKNLPKKMWETENSMKWHEDKVSHRVEELEFVQKRVADILAPTYVTLPTLSFQRLVEGQDMFEHADSPGPDNQDQVTANDPHGACAFIEWGSVVYINDDYEGGEIFYRNKGVEYKPKAGDLLIHGSGHDCMHGVRTVTKGIRYAYSTFSHKPM